MKITERSEMKLVEEKRFKDYYFRLNRPLFSEDFILEVYLYCPEKFLDY